MSVVETLWDHQRANSNILWLSRRAQALARRSLLSTRYWATQRVATSSLVRDDSCVCGLLSVHYVGDTTPFRPLACDAATRVSLAFSLFGHSRSSPSNPDAIMTAAL